MLAHHESEESRSAPHSDGKRVELWYQPTQTGGSVEVEPVVGMLRRLDERGDVADVAVEAWDREVDVSGGLPPDPAAVRTFDRFGQIRRWARQRGDQSFESGEPTQVGVGRMGPEREVQRVPRAALLEFENGVLTNVTLCEEATGSLTRRLGEIAVRERETEARVSNTQSDRTTERKAPSGREREAPSQTTETGTEKETETERRLRF
jgi:hypothetical protein